MPQVKEVSMLLPIPVQPQHKEKVQQAAPNATFHFFDSVDDVTQQVIDRVDVVLGNHRRRLFQAAPNLKWMQLNSAGSDLYVKEGVLRPDILLTSANGVYGLPISEHMLGMLLCLMRQLHHYRDNQHKQLWERSAPYVMLEGANVLVVGLGDLGGTFARKVKALGAHVTGVRRTSGQKPDYIDELYTMEDLDSLLPKADVVALALPKTPHTVKAMDEKRLGLLKQGAFLLNMGRGDALETDPLVALLQSRHLGGAGLDVTDPEPLPPGHPLWTCDNALITPHCSGGNRQIQTVDRIVDLYVENLCRYQNDEPLLNVVDRRAGY